MPSVPAVCGQERAAAPHGAHGSPGGRATELEVATATAVDLGALGRGERAHRCRRACRPAGRARRPRRAAALEAARRVDGVGVDPPAGVGAGGAARRDPSTARRPAPGRTSPAGAAAAVPSAATATTRRRGRAASALPATSPARLGCSVGGHDARAGRGHARWPCRRARRTGRPPARPAWAPTSSATHCEARSWT